MSLLRRLGLILALCFFSVLSAAAHHGGTSISQGPGTPIETNTPITLPKGTAVVFSRAEIAAFRKFSREDPNNIDSFRFYQLGASYGLTDSLMATVILPFNAKSQDGPGGGTARGLGDVTFLLNLGMNYDGVDGLRLNTAEDVAVDIGESGKWYFGAYGGLTAPSGRSDIDLGLGVDGGLQPGFGSVTGTIGLNAQKALSSRLSLLADTSIQMFTPVSGGDKFGNEFRANLAGVYNLHSNSDEGATLKQWDASLELNYLKLSRDETAGVADLGTGGSILYITPGMRFQVGDVNLGAGVKLPLLKGLNERNLQQGSEGLEKFRLILTSSIAF